MRNENATQPQERLEWTDNSFRLFIGSVKDYAIFRLDLHRAVGVSFAVSSSAAPVPHTQGLSSPQAIRSRLSDEIQLRVNHRGERGGTQS